MLFSRENDFDGPIAASAARWHVPVPLIKAVIATESAFNPAALNKNDPGFAWGLMQMIPATARGLGYNGPMETLITNTTLAIELGSQLLGQNLVRAGNVVADSVSAYNGGFRPALGFGSVKANGQYGNQAYVTKVLEYYEYFTKRQTPVGGGEKPPGTPPFRRRMGDHLRRRWDDIRVGYTRRSVDLRR